MQLVIVSQTYTCAYCGEKVHKHGGVFYSWLGSRKHQPARYQKTGRRDCEMHSCR